MKCAEDYMQGYRQGKRHMAGIILDWLRRDEKGMTFDYEQVKKLLEQVVKEREGHE